MANRRGPTPHRRDLQVAGILLIVAGLVMAGLVGVDRHDRSYARPFGGELPTKQCLLPQEYCQPKLSKNGQKD